ncbi:chitin elicitor receptor kinase 1-like [Vigna umbellata]|uniref:chitin elicitor receptor kinase 1-like n=1 Tax=Vigna umbellata TaxID=87088 RepID=UPI001F5F5E81|nr:chitin elicitor receptor kinase 1-like [Vigna umbellata]
MEIFTRRGFTLYGFSVEDDTCGFNSSSQNKPFLCFRYRSQSTLTPPWIRKYKPSKMAFFAAATHNFDPKRKIRDDGFGSVYLAQLRDNRLAVVKYLHRNHSSVVFSTKSFCNEILILSSIHHANLVKLHGYCSDLRGRRGRRPTAEKKTNLKKTLSRP